MNLNISAVTEAIGIPNFNRKELLDIALTHPSYINENTNLTTQQKKQQEIEYRRLALLGDAILGAIVTDYLYRRLPTNDKGAISDFKSNLVNKKRLSEFACELNLRQLCLLGRNATEIEKHEQNRFLSETFEALFGAIYLEFERDFSRAGDWIVNLFIAPTVNEISNLIQQPSPSAIGGRTKEILGNDLLGAIVIDYLYHRFPEGDEGKLTQWKSKLVGNKELFTKDFKAELAKIYLEFERDFQRTRNWAVERFLLAAVNDLLAEEQYSTAVVDADSPRELQILASQIWDKTRREEFLQLASAMKPADELLLLMKQQIDVLGSENKTLQQLLYWGNQKSLAIELPYKPAEVRAFYLALIRVLGLAFVKTLDPNVKLNGSESRRFASHFERAHSLVSRPDVNITLNLSQGFEPAGVIARVFAFDLSPELKLVLQELQAIIPSPKNDIKGFEQWRQDNGAAWIGKLKDAIGYDLHLGQEEKEIVKQYYDAHHLLVECLNSEGCEVTIAVRQQIEETLLLP